MKSYLYTETWLSTMLVAFILAFLTNSAVVRAQCTPLQDHIYKPPHGDNGPSNDWNALDFRPGMRQVPGMLYPLIVFVHGGGGTGGDKGEAFVPPGIGDVFALLRQSSFGIVSVNYDLNDPIEPNATVGFNTIWDTSDQIAQALQYVRDHPELFCADKIILAGSLRSAVVSYASPHLLEALVLMRMGADWLSIDPTAPDTFVGAQYETVGDVQNAIRVGEIPDFSYIAGTDFSQPIHPTPFCI